MEGKAAHTQQRYLSNVEYATCWTANSWYKASPAICMELLAQESPRNRGHQWWH